jgi:GH15 family glucan-1,4-alpha-glucosidase
MNIFHTQTPSIDYKNQCYSPREKPLKLDDLTKIQKKVKNTTFEIKKSLEQYKNEKTDKPVEDFQHFLEKEKGIILPTFRTNLGGFEAAADLLEYYNLKKTEDNEKTRNKNLNKIKEFKSEIKECIKQVVTVKCTISDKYRK